MTRFDDIRAWLKENFPSWSTCDTIITVIGIPLCCGLGACLWVLYRYCTGERVNPISRKLGEFLKQIAEDDTFQLNRHRTKMVRERKRAYKLDVAVGEIAKAVGDIATALAAAGASGGAALAAITPKVAAEVKMEIGSDEEGSNFCFSECIEESKSILVFDLRDMKTKTRVGCWPFCRSDQHTVDVTGTILYMEAGNDEAFRKLRHISNLLGREALAAWGNQKNDPLLNRI